MGRDNRAIPRCPRTCTDPADTRGLLPGCGGLGIAGVAPRRGQTARPGSLSDHRRARES